MQLGLAPAIGSVHGSGCKARGAVHSGYYGQAVQRRRRPSPCQPFGTGQISPHAALSPPYWALPNFVGSALPEGKSAAVAATRNTQTGSKRRLGGTYRTASCGEIS